MDHLKEGYFTETGTIVKDPVISIKVDELLFKGKSKYQDIMLFKSKSCGRVLVLDDAIQCTERDEFAYQEMISFLPLYSHPDPKDVLIIGGGDGGVAREVAKHPSVVSIVQCEIDQKVVDVSKEHLPFMAVGFDSPKLELKIGDGIDFIQQTDRKFDVIITDSSDPIGPAEVLFKKPYYEGLKKILKPGGIVCSQGESIWYDLDLVAGMVKMGREVFPKVDYASIYIPTYPGGQIGFLLCSVDQGMNFREPKKELSDDDVESMTMKYYNTDIHKASFIMPTFAKKKLGC